MLAGNPPSHFIWRLGWSWRTCFPGGSLTRLISWFCLLLGDLGASLCKLLHGDAWMSSWHSEWLPPVQIIQEKAKWKTQCLLWTSLRSQTLLFPQYPIGFTGQPYSVLEWTTQGVNLEDSTHWGLAWSWIPHNTMMFTRDLPKVHGKDMEGFEVKLKWLC